jgi:hypothetical protein
MNSLVFFISFTLFGYFFQLVNFFDILRQFLHILCLFSTYFYNHKKTLFKTNKLNNHEKTFTRNYKKVYNSLSTYNCICSFTTDVKAGELTFSVKNATLVNNGTTGDAYNAFGRYYMEWTGLKAYRQTTAGSSISLTNTTICESDGKYNSTTSSTVQLDGSSQTSKYVKIFYSDVYDITGITINSFASSTSRTWTSVATLVSSTYPGTTVITFL